MGSESVERISKLAKFPRELPVRIKPLNELAFDAVLVRSDPKMRIDWTLLRKRIDDFYNKDDFTAIVHIVTVLIEAPFWLKKEYKEPCLTCMLQNLATGVLGIGEETGYCSNCTNNDQPVIECKLLSTCGIAECCVECCDDIKLLKS